MTHNFEISFTCPKGGNKFLRKDNMLQHVKKHSQNVCKFYYDISWLYLQTVLLIYIPRF